MVETNGDTAPGASLVKEVLFTEEQVTARVNEMALEIIELYRDKDPLFIGLGRGGIKFTAELMSAMVKLDPDFHPEVDYITASTYGRGDTAGETKILNGLNPHTEVKGRIVIVIDDVLDTGATTPPIIEDLYKSEATAVDLVVFIEKDVERPNGPVPKLVGFRAPNEWLIGMGMDYAEKGRWLGFIATMNQPASA